MSKKDKPKPGTKLGEALKRYTNKNGPHFDAAFTTRIRKLRPWWFDKSATKKSKEELLKIAMKPIV